MAAVARREVERKYEVPEGAEARIDWSTLEGHTVSADPVEHRMEAVYHDTEDMALGRRLVALRRRRGGADDGWHVKFDEPGGRQELQVPLLQAPGRMPAAVRNLLAGLTGGQPVRPVATVRTHRRVLAVSGADGTEVAEIAVDDVEAVDERTGTVRSWAEWEVELVDGTSSPDAQAQIFDAVEAVLATVGGKRSASRAKIARALGEEDTGGSAASAGPGGAQEAGAVRPGRGAPRTSGRKKAGKKRPGPDVLRAVLGELAEQLVLWDFKVRLDAPDAVHQMRVTSRSLRSVLRAAAPLLDSGAARELDAGLRTLARALSAARDAEVTAQLLGGRAGELGGRVDPEAAEFLRRAAEEQARAAAGRVRRHVRSGEHLRLLADVRAFAAAPPLAGTCARLSAREVADFLVHRTLRKALRATRRGPEVEGAGAAAGAAELEHLHDVRKAVKRVRYVAAVLERTGFSPGRAMRRAAAGAQGYQDALGEVMDAAVVEEWLAGTARSRPGAGGDRYAVGLLHGAEVVRLRTGLEGATGVVGALRSQLREDLA